MNRVSGRFLLIIVVLFLFSVWRSWQATETPGSRRPFPEIGEPAAPPDYGSQLSPLPEQSILDPSVSVGLGEKTSSTGTAFALHDHGLWMTARHVVDQCDQIQLRFPRRIGLVVQRIALHPTADIALLSTVSLRSNLLLASRRLSVGQHGFHIGYPQGREGEVWSILLGRRRMRVRGRYRTDEPVVAWVERHRRPTTLSSLGGLSGGPTFDAAGRVVGVLVAASQRRGRVYSAAPASIREMFSDELIEKSSGRAVAISSASLRARADALRNNAQVAKVICLVRK